MRKIILSLFLAFSMVLPAFAAKKIIDAYTIKQEHSDLRKIVSDKGLKMGFENSDDLVRTEPVYDLDWSVEPLENHYAQVVVFDKKVKKQEKIEE